MRNKKLEIILWTTLIGGLIGLAVIAWLQQSTTMQPPRTPLITTPTTVGCTGSISVRIEEDGSITSWCAGEVNN